jgi:DNA-binding beta-propeller fold protein YncE
MWLTVAAVAVTAGLLIRARREAAVTTDPRSGELGGNFRYDVSALKRLDPRLLIGEEKEPIPALVESPHALALDTADRLIVGGENEIAVIETNGAVRARLPVPFAVRCVAVDEEGTLYAGHAGHVGVYRLGGEAAVQWPSLGTNAVLTSIAVAGEDVWVADAGQRRVWRLDQQGRVLSRIGDKDDGQGGFIIPSPHFDLAIGSAGELWIVDPGRHTLMSYGRDGARRSAWGRGGAEPEGFSGCCNPTDIAIRPDGSFVTSEKGLVRVKLYTSAGALVGVVAGPDKFDAEVRGLDLAVDRAGRIMVLDPVRVQVRVFEVDVQTGK